MQLRVSTPSDTALVLSSTVQVSGSVSPSTARVQVQGRRAQVSGGRAGRASADYRVDREGRAAIEGRIVLGVVRDRGQPRIALIAVTPAA